MTKTVEFIDVSEMTNRQICDKIDELKGIPVGETYRAHIKSSIIFWVIATLITVGIICLTC